MKNIKHNACPKFAYSIYFPFSLSSRWVFSSLYMVSFALHFFPLLAFNFLSDVVPFFFTQLISYPPSSSQSQSYHLFLSLLYSNSSLFCIWIRCLHNIILQEYHQDIHIPCDTYIPCDIYNSRWYRAMARVQYWPAAIHTVKLLT